MNSVVWLFSIFNEIENAYFWANLAFLQKHQQFLVIVDGGSTDGTREKLDDLAISYQVLSPSTRGARFNESLLNNQKDIFVFVHPRTMIPEKALEELMMLSHSDTWGAFTHRFDYSHYILRFTSWWSNSIRGDIKGIFYLDHILWARSELIIQIGGFPSEAIFEDTILCRKLMRLSRPTRLSSVAITSAIRFEKNGIYKQSLLNQMTKIKFFFGVSVNDINKTYESGIELNGK